MTVTNVDDRNRETNGRFARELRTEAGELQDGDMNVTHTFCHPLRAATAEEAIEFFENVEIPEITLSNIEFAYRDFREQQVNAQTEIWKIDWQRTEDFAEFSRKCGKAGMTSAQFQFEGEKRVNAQREKFMDERPREILAFDAVKFARAAQLYTRTAHLPDEEIAKVDAHIVQYGGRDWTVKELATTFQTSRWFKDAATTSDLRVARTSQRASEAMIAAIERLNLD